MEQYDQITDLNVKLGENMELGEYGNIASQNSCFNVMFKSRGGIGINLDRRDPSFDDETVEILDFLQNLQYKTLSPKAGEPKHVTIKLHVEFSCFANRSRDQFLTHLNKFTTPMTHIWPAYRHTSGKMNIQFGQMYDRSRVKGNWAVIPKDSPIVVRSKDGEPISQWTSAKHGESNSVDNEGQQQGDITKPQPNVLLEVPEIPAKFHFLDVTEGVTALGYGATVEHRFAQMNYERLEQLTHKVAFTLVEESVVQAHISFRA